MHAIPQQPAKRELDTYVCKRPLPGVSVRRAAVADVVPLLEQARAEIVGSLANFDHISRILNHNSECIWVVDRAETAGSGGTRAIGFHAFLPLSRDGKTALVENRFAFLRPDLSHITTPGELPAALYWWASLGRGSTATAISWIMEKLCTPRYRSLDIYSRPATQHGARALRNVGFRPLADADDRIGSVVVYRRLANRAHLARPQLS